MCPDALERVLEKFHDLRIFFFLEKKETIPKAFGTRLHENFHEARPDPRACVR